MGEHGHRDGTRGDAMITSDKLIVGPWVAKQIFGAFHPESSEAIGLERAGRIVAGVIYEQWNGRSIVCHIAVQGLMTPAYLAAIFHYPFVHLGAAKIIAPINEGNTKSVRFVDKLGFRLEARLLDASPDGSLLLYTMGWGDCRYIGERYASRLTAQHCISA